MLPDRPRRATLLALALAALVACQDGRSGAPNETKVTQVASARPVPSADELGLPPDLDLDSLARELGCDSAAAGSLRGDACRLVQDFGQASEVDALPATGQAVWFGQAFVLLGGQHEWREFYFLQWKSGRGQGGGRDKATIEYSVAARALIPEGTGQTADAERLLGAVRAHSPPPADSPAAQFVKTTPPEDGFFGMSRTRGPSLFFDEFARAHFVRQSGPRLLMLEEQPGETCAVELWPVP
jgi:hypothetical protein